MVNEDGTFVKGNEDGDGNEYNEGNAQEDAEEATKRRIVKKWVS